jgi:hypothetical protein
MYFFLRAMIKNSTGYLETRQAHTLNGMSEQPQCTPYLIEYKAADMN